MEAVVVPEFETKLFYRINEVSKITGIEDYVLRYWESEFPQLCPHKGKNKTRLYKKEDIVLVFRIKGLLKEQKFTIQGAKEYLKKSITEEKKKSVIESKAVAEAKATEEKAAAWAKTTEEKTKAPEVEIIHITTEIIPDMKNLRKKLGLIRNEISALISAL